MKKTKITRESSKKYYPQQQQQKDIDHSKSYLISSIRRPRAETMPTATISIDTTDNHFIDSTWLNPSTPTTDQLLKGDNSNTIISTFASLGLDDTATTSTLHTSHSYSSLHTLSENQQQQWYPDLYQHRPRALSAVDHQQPEHFPSIWHKPNFNTTRPYLRNSNSSADLLEMMAIQQRKAEDWTGVNSTYLQCYVYYISLPFLPFMSFSLPSLSIGPRIL